MKDIYRHHGILSGDDEAEKIAATAPSALLDQEPDQGCIPVDHCHVQHRLPREMPLAVGNIHLHAGKFRCVMDRLNNFRSS